MKLFVYMFMSIHVYGLLFQKSSYWNTYLKGSHSNGSHNELFCGLFSKNNSILISKRFRKYSGIDFTEKSNSNSSKEILKHMYKQYVLNILCDEDINIYEKYKWINHNEIQPFTIINGELFRSWNFEI